MERINRALQSEETRGRIIRAATKLFARKGYYATSIADLAGAVELTKGALYHHFKSKEAIFFAVIESIRKAWRDVVVRDVLKSRDALERVSILVDRHARLASENESFCLVLNTLMMEMDGVNASFLSALKEVYSELAGFIEQIVRKGVASRQIRPDLDEKATTLAIVGILRGIGCSRPIYESLQADYNAMVEASKKVLISGLRP